MKACFDENGATNAALPERRAIIDFRLHKSDNNVRFSLQQQLIDYHGLEFSSEGASSETVVGKSSRAEQYANILHCSIIR